jgi:nitrogen fixation/metabolism regulation signal transduction histidine kinase
MEKKNVRHLKNFLINSPVQLRIILISIIYMGIILLAASAIIFFPFIYELNMSKELDSQYLAAQAFLTLTRNLPPVMFMGAVLFFVHMIVVTHKICGPLVNLVRTCRRVADGDLSTVMKVRDGDYFSDEADEVNRMIRFTAERYASLKSSNKKMHACFEQLLAESKDEKLKSKIESALEEMNMSGAKTEQVVKLPVDLM